MGRVKLAKPPSGLISLDEWFFPLIWQGNQPITLFDSRGNGFTFKKGERVYSPKLLELWDAMHQHKAIYWGGAKGGGKTFGGVRALAKWGMFLAEIGHPGAKMAVFRETIPAITSTHTLYIRAGKTFPEWMGVYNDNLKLFTAADWLGGWMIEYRTTTDYDITEKSTEYAAILIDESTNQTEGFFNHIQTCMRWTTDGVPVPHNPIILASNPTGIGLAWHIRRFVREPAPGQIGDGTGQDIPAHMVGRDTPRETFIEGRGMVKTKGHHYIKALPTDNPANSDTYLAELKNKPPKIRDAYYYGSHEAFEGQFIDFDFKAHTYFSRPFPKEWPWYLAVDYANNHTAAAYCGPMAPDGTLYIDKGISVVHKSAGELKKLMDKEFRWPPTPEQKAKGEPGSRIEFAIAVADPSMWKGDGSYEGNKTPIEILTRDGDGKDGSDTAKAFQLVPANNSREVGWHALREAMFYQYAESDTGGQGGYSRDLLTIPKFRVNQELQYMIQSLQFLQFDPKNSEDCIKSKGEYGPGEGDDEAETGRYLVMAAIKREYRAMPPPKDYGTVFQAPQSGGPKTGGGSFWV